MFAERWTWYKPKATPRGRPWTIHATLKLLLSPPSIPDCGEVKCRELSRRIKPNQKLLRRWKCWRLRRS